MLGHDEVHFNYGLDGYRSCICTCKSCWSVKTGLCACKECSCGDPTPLPPPHTPLEDKTTHTTAEHPCAVCGNEVTRNSNRGRWPTRCLECKK